VGLWIATKGGYAMRARKNSQESLNLIEEANRIEYRALGLTP